MMKYLITVAILPAVLLLAKPEGKKGSFEVYKNKIDLNTTNLENDFQKIANLFEQFSGKHKKSVKMKMGEQPFIQHIYYKEFRQANTEVKYDLTIHFIDNGFRISGSAHEYLLFNKKRTKFKLIEPIQLSTIAGDQRIISCNQYIGNEAEKLYELLKNTYQPLD